MIDRIKALCKERGISFNELEELAGIGKNTVYRWGTIMPSADKLSRVAKVLGVTTEELLREDGEGVSMAQTLR